MADWKWKPRREDDPAGYEPVNDGQCAICGSVVPMQLLSFDPDRSCYVCPSCAE